MKHFSGQHGESRLDLELESDFVLLWSFQDLFNLQSKVSGLNGATSVSGIRSAAPGLFDSAR